MHIIEAILLGVIQGLTEFLPVSSSGHLVLFQKIFGISEPALFFDTMLHVGTLVAVFAVLWKDIWAILRKLNQPLTLYLIIATVPTVIFALMFRKPIEQAFETGQFLGFAFLATSALLVMAELLAKRAAQKRLPTGGGLPTNGGLDKMNWLDSLVIGLMQAIAVIPGISRSGATLSGALSRGLNRDFAARFSFMLSIPAILGAAVFHIKDLVKGREADIAATAETTNALGTSAGIGAAAIIAGTITAAIVGFFAIRLMLKIVREKSLWGFAIYTGALGLLVLADQFILGIVF
ncbi:MAG: undecaprenyl-diphosphate phosphatase [Treponema sp.]|nr:undecaprenyl-diphosphate phosphatase [Treponema sp.]